MVQSIILVGVGGALGSILRYITGLLVTRYFPSIFPFGTFIINILGCLVIGLILGIIYKQEFANQDLKLLLITGFCGGYTTFSAFASENIQLFQQGQSVMALVYIAVSVLLGLLAVWLGLSLVRLF